MFTRFKKFAAAFIAIMLLCSCAGEKLPEASGGGKQPAMAESAEMVESSIFGRNVSYNAYSPADDLSVPISSGGIFGMAQIEKLLYFLGDGAVYSLDTETGDSKKLFDTSATAVTTHGGMLYTYSNETAVLSSYDPADGFVNDIPFKIDGIDSVEGLSVTDDYYVFKCRITGEVYIETYLMIYSRETGEQTLSKKAPMSGIDLYPYKGNKLLSMTYDSTFVMKHLNEFDVETGNSKNIQNLSLDHNSAVAYCPKTDTAIVYGIPSSISIGGESTVSDVPCPVTEYSLSDTDSIVLNRYYIDVSSRTGFFLSTYENVVCAVTTSDDKCRVYDCLNPPESITILGNSSATDLIYSFEKTTGILVKNATTVYDRLHLKLMAGDDDFDLYYTGSGYHYYVNAGTFVDLKTVESLNSRISKNAVADLIVSYDGKYFGMPMAVSNFCDEKFYPEDGSQYCYSLIASENLYYANNIDVAEGRYDDPSGEELYKLFKYLNDNPTGNRKKMPFGDSVMILSAGVYLMNPQSKNRDAAIKFLEYVFDVYSGEITGVVPEDDLYPAFDPNETYFIEWRCRPAEIVHPIFDARNAILSKNGELSNSELKKLARETAAEVAMRIGE